MSDAKPDRLLSDRNQTVQPEDTLLVQLRVNGQQVRRRILPYGSTHLAAVILSGDCKDAHFFCQSLSDQVFLD